MKIRVMGTKPECEQAQRYYLSLGNEDGVKGVSVSKLYPNRKSVNIYRVYIEVEYFDISAPSSNPALTDRARKTR